MIRNYERVDYIFVQSTAWFLGHDIMMVCTTSTESHQYMTISGNLTDETVRCPGIELTIGSKSQVHYQSLLPLPLGVGKDQVKADTPANTIKLEASARGKPMEDDHPGLSLDSSHPDRTHPRLEWMEDFLELQPSKGRSQGRSTDKRMQVKKQAAHITETEPKLNKVQPDIKERLQRNIKPDHNSVNGLPYHNQEHKIDDLELPLCNGNKVFVYQMEGKIRSFQFMSGRELNVPNAKITKQIFFNISKKVAAAFKT